MRDDVGAGLRGGAVAALGDGIAGILRAAVAGLRDMLLHAAGVPPTQASLVAPLHAAPTAPLQVAATGTGAGGGRRTSARLAVAGSRLGAGAIAGDISAAGLRCDVPAARAGRDRARAGAGRGAAARWLDRVGVAGLRIADALTGLRYRRARLRPIRAGGVAPQHVVVFVEVLRVLRRVLRGGPRRLDGGVYGTGGYPGGLRAGVDLRIDVVRRDAGRRPRVHIVAYGGGRAGRCRGNQAVGAAVPGIGDERQAGVVVALRPVRIAPLADDDGLGEIDARLARAIQRIGGRERIGANLGPAHGIPGIHLRIAGGVGIDRRIVGEPRVVIHVVERAVVDRRWPQLPVFIRQAGFWRAGRGGIDRESGQRIRGRCRQCRAAASP